MLVLSILVYVLFFALLFFILRGNREQQLLSLIFVNILFYINITLIQKPELTPFQLLPYLFFAKEILFNFNDFKTKFFSFPVKTGLGLVFIAYFLTTYSNGGNTHDYYEAFRYCFDKYIPMIAAFICAKDVDERELVRCLFFFALVFCGLGLIEFLLDHNYVREAIAKTFPSTRVSDMFGPAGITQGVSSSGWRSRISITTKHPTTLGTLLSTMFLFSLAYLKIPPGRINRKKVVIVLFAILGTTVLSGSRTALGCIFVGLLVFFTLQLSPLKRFLAVIIYAVIAMQLVPSVINAFEERESGSSLSLRQQQLTFTLVESEERAMFGHGLYFTNHVILASDVFGNRLYYSKAETEGLESIIFYTLLDIGFFGAFVLIVFYGQTIIYFVRRRKENAHLSIQGFLETFLLVVFLVLSGEIGRNTEMSLLFIGTSLGLLQRAVENKQQDFSTALEYENDERLE